ncbi:lamin tail domain-containing protein [Lysobacter sp. A3-1-A15]|uniref:lamin tail domain-containing protein n=1 Tax=Novilysobacter viscosus TaxID=3098602 RepID=UPI002ED8EBD7
MNRTTGRIAAWALVLCTGLGAAGTAGAQVVVSQVYGGGGNSGATLRSDFIELRNTGAAAVTLDGWSVQYASSGGSSWQRTPLSGSIAPGGYYLVKQADGAGGSLDLPTPDATGTIAMAGTNGKVALVSSGGALSGACPLAAATVVDFVGYGGSANCFEGAGATATLSNTTAALRNGDGSVDTDDNAADFTRGTPDPRNSGAQPPAPPDPPIALPIAQIQGDGLASPYDGRSVVTEGVVTAIKFNNGFFLQSANDDGNPATSEGIFVFTGSAPPAAAAVGNRVRVTATVKEFIPSSNVNQLAITELVSPTIDLLENGVALPAPVELSAAELRPEALPGTLERLEGMRVSVAESVVVAPSGGSIDENDARAFSDGVFHVVLPGIERPFREAGIGILDRSLDTLPAGKNPPLFDTNPERLMVRSRGQVGAVPLSVDVEATVSGLVGVLDYFAGTWALLPDVATPPAVAGGRLPAAVNDADYDQVTIAGFNLLRLFDEVADGNGAVTLTPEALDKRLAKASAAICDYLKAPDILGVVEVENLRVLQLLSDRLSATCPLAPAYVPHLEPGNDVGGINVGYLVNTRDAGDGQPRVQVLGVTQFGKDATIANPNGTTSLLNDRPPLALRAVVHDGRGGAYPVTVINNHLRSLNGIDNVAPGSSGWATGGERVRVKRGAQAAYLAGLVEQMQANDPAAHIVLVGDFNAFEVNDGYVDVMGIIRGDEAAPERVLTYVDSPLTSLLVDGSQLIADNDERYSYVFAGNAQTLDHVLVNEAVVNGVAGLSVEHARINADFGVDNFGDAGIAVRSSDHDPVRLAIRVPAFTAADLAVTVEADVAAARAGGNVAYRARVSNAGPGAGAFASVAFVFDALLAPEWTDVEAGWACAAPVQDDATTTLTCTHPSLAAGGQATFGLQAVMPETAGHAPLTLAVATQSTTRDPANGNNRDSVSVARATSADLSVRIVGSAAHLRRGAVATFLVPVTNAGPDAAELPRLVIEANVDPRVAAAAAPPGWQCVRIAGASFRAECTADTAVVAGTRWFAFALVVPGTPSRGADWVFQASVEAATHDPVPGNNDATLLAPARRR